MKEFIKSLPSKASRLALVAAANVVIFVGNLCVTAGEWLVKKLDA